MILYDCNKCNRLLRGNTPIARGLTSCKMFARQYALRKTWSTKFPLWGGKPYLSSGLYRHRQHNTDTSTSFLVWWVFIYKGQVCNGKWAASWQNQQNGICDQQRQISLGTRPVWSSNQPGHPPSLIRVFTVRMKKAWVFSYPLSTQRRLWADWANAQADLSLRWAHSHFVGFVMRRLKYIMTLSNGSLLNSSEPRHQEVYCSPSISPSSPWPLFLHLETYIWE